MSCQSTLKKVNKPNIVHPIINMSPSQSEEDNEVLSCYHPSCESPKDNKKNGQCIFCQKLFHHACLGIRATTSVVCKVCSGSLMNKNKCDVNLAEFQKLKDELEEIKRQCESLKQENNELKSQLKKKKQRVILYSVT